MGLAADSYYLFSLVATVAGRKSPFPPSDEQNQVDCCLEALPIDFAPPGIQPSFCSLAMKEREVIDSRKTTAKRKQFRSS